MTAVLLCLIFVVLLVIEFRLSRILKEFRK